MPTARLGEPPKHRENVPPARKLESQCLRTGYFNKFLDQWNLGLGERLPEFMESLVRDSRFVLIIGTQGYKDRFDGRKSGVGYEGHIISGEILNARSTDKFIPVLRSGDWTTSIPTALAAVTGVELRGNPYVEEQYRILVRSLHGVKDEPPPLGGPPDWLTGTETTALPLGTIAPLAKKEEVEHAYSRQVEIWSVTALDRSPADFWKAGQSAILTDAAWPLSLYWYSHTGGDQFVTRDTLSNGFRTDYSQNDVLIDRSEWFECENPGRIVIRETQEFPNRHRDGGFPYDTAIATTADAVRFGAAFFRSLGVGDANEIAIKISWHGIKGRFITADTLQILPSYQQRRSNHDDHSSPLVQFRLVDRDRHFTEHVRQLVTGLLNQFDLFDPSTDTYNKVIEHWKRLGG